MKQRCGSQSHSRQPDSSILFFANFWSDMQVVEVMSFFSSGTDQPVEDGGGDDYGYDNR
jgi:hypothetical protein